MKKSAGKIKNGSTPKVPLKNQPIGEKIGKNNVKNKKKLRVQIVTPISFLRFLEARVFCGIILYNYRQISRF